MNKILISCQQSPNRYSIPAYDFWRYYFLNGLREAGFSTIECPVDWVAGLILKEEQHFYWQQETWAKTIEICKKERPSIFLSYLYPEQINPSAVKIISGMGIPCVNFFCDNVREYRQAPTEFGCFDLNWVPEFKALKYYRSAGYNYIHAPMPMWVDPIYRTNISEHLEIDQISFIGSKDSVRAQFFSKVLSKGAPIRIMGSGWDKKEVIEEKVEIELANFYNTFFNQYKFFMRFGIKGLLYKIENRIFNHPPNEETFLDAIDPKPDGQTYIDITRRSMITLGANKYPSFWSSFRHPDTYSRLRDLEAPMLGACYLTEWTEGLDQLYEIGEEIEIYHNEDDLITKLDELSKSPQKRRKLRMLGQHRALTQHSIPQTLKRIFNAL